MVSDAQLTGGARLTLTEPGASSGPAIENVTFDGNEMFDVLQPNEPGSYIRRFLPTNFAGSGYNQFQGIGFIRNVPQQVFFDPVTGATLVLPFLEEIRKTPATALGTGNTTEHVRVADVRISGPTGVPNERGFQLFGARSGAASLPAQGTATFVGEFYGDFFLTTAKTDGAGDAVITVDFANRQITGRLTISQYLGSGPPIEIEFVADIVGDAIISRTLSAKGVGGIILAGTVQGSFYGSAADEIALVFSASGASGNVIGALVAGKE